MARSHSIYVVLVDGVPVNGFTVKHELVAWLAAHGSPHMSIYKMRDNPTFTEQEVVDMSDVTVGEAVGLWIK